jgi:hypothetical protein
MFYVYAHLTADTEEVFYIGKGCTTRCASLKSRSKFWKSIAAKHGRRFLILFRGDEQQCLREEKRLISKIGRRDLGNGPLVNLTDGGDGLLNPSDQTRRRMSEARAGVPMSEEQRALRRNKVHSEDTRRRMSESHKNLIRTPEHCLNLRVKRKPITGQRISESTTGSKNHSARAIILEHRGRKEERFECAKDAIVKYNLVQSEVSKCCRGIRSEHRGFKVRYA